MSFDWCSFFHFHADFLVENILYNCYSSLLFLCQSFWPSPFRIYSNFYFGKISQLSVRKKILYECINVQGWGVKGVYPPPQKLWNSPHYPLNFLKCIRYPPSNIWNPSIYPLKIKSLDVPVPIYYNL